MNIINDTYHQTHFCGWEVHLPAKLTITRHPIRYLDLCTYPFLLLLCTVGNVVGLLVLNRDRSFGSKNVYLMAIALVDLLYMWSALISYMSNYDGEIHGRPRTPLLSFSEATYGLAIFVQETCAVASAWLIVAFTLERYMAIKYPLEQLGVQGKRTVTLVGFIFTVAVITVLPRLIDYYWFYANHLRVPHLRHLKVSRPANLQNLNMTSIWLLIAIQLFTFMTILIVNLFLIRRISRFNRRRREILSTHRLHMDKYLAYTLDWGALAMLGSCVVLYLLTQSITFVSNILYLLDYFCVKKMDRSSTNIVGPIRNVLLNLNYTLNFFLYCGVNQNFRKSVSAIILRGQIRLRTRGKHFKPLAQLEPTKHIHNCDKLTAHTQETFLVAHN